MRVARSCGSPCCKVDVRDKIPSPAAPYRRLLYRRSVGSAQQRHSPAHLSLHSGGNCKFRKSHRGSHYLLRDEVRKSRALRGRTPLKAGPCLLRRPPSGKVLAGPYLLEQTKPPEPSMARKRSNGISVQLSFHVFLLAQRCPFNLWQLSSLTEGAREREEEYFFRCP